MKRSTLVALAAILLVALGGAGFAGYRAGQSGSGLPDGSHSTVAEASVTPGAGYELDSLSAEARRFVTAYKDLYKDPLATYYAEKAYTEQTGGRSGNLDPAWLTAYDFNAGPNVEGKSPLDFPFIDLSIGTKMNTETAVNVFNTYSVPNLDRYMILISKSPTREAIAVIDNEFLTYIGRDNPGTQRLLNTLKTVVDKYGSAAVYSLAPGSLTEGEGGNTVFRADRFNIDAIDPDGNAIAIENEVDLMVNVEAFSQTGAKTNLHETLDTTRLTIVRVAPAGPVDPGLISLGQKR